MNKIVLISVLSAVLMMLVGCSSVIPKKMESGVQVGEKVLLASGYGKLQNQPQLTAKQNRLATEQAAKIKAYRALADLLYREKLTNGLLVANQVIKDEPFRIYIDLFLREAKVIESLSIADQQKVLLRLHLSPRFYHCISSTVERVSQCLQEDGKTPFTRIGYQQAPVSTVNLACSGCGDQLSISGFSKEKQGIDGILLDAGLYDTEWVVNMATKTMLRYFFISQFVINSSYHP